MRIFIAFLLSWLFMCLGACSALADEVDCAAIKRALVSSNLALMRVERGPLPVAPVQAALAIGQFGALMHLAQLACSEDDAGKITDVVTPRIEALQSYLPLAPTDAGDRFAPAALTNNAARPPMPPADARKQIEQKPSSSATCERSYYMKAGHRYWRCKR
jgi:hypothetical protein